MDIDFLYGYIVVVLIVLIVIMVVRAGRGIIRTVRTNATAAKVNEAIGQSAGGFDSGSARALEIITERVREDGGADLIDKFTYAYIMDKYVLRADAAHGRTKEKLKEAIGEKYRDIIGEILADPVTAQRQLVRGRYAATADFDIIDIVADIRNYELDNDAFGIAPRATELFVDQFARRDKLEAVREQKPKTRAGFIDTYLKESKHIKTDSQNVHDSALTRDLKETLDKTTEETGRTHTDRPYEIDVEIRAIADRTRNANALRALQAMRAGCGVVKPYDETESDILDKMWNRAYLADNAGREKEIKEAIVAALGDCVEHDNVVCPSGRAARVLSALQFVDNDPKVGAALTVDMYRAQIYDETKKIIDDHIARAAQSEDSELKKYAESFNNAEITYDPAAEQAFKNEVRADIDKNISQYKEKINSGELERVAGDCRALVDMF